MAQVWRGKRYWLVGASEGLGRALAVAMAKAGAEVIVSARSRERLNDLVAEIGANARAVTVDVSDRASVDAAAAEVGPVDGMVYLAGVYWPMKSQDWDSDRAEAMVETNFLGGVRAVGAVLPAMLERGVGHIVLTGSLSGFRGLPGAIGYGASKAGLMYLAESLYADLRRSPVKVQIANPGFIKTRLTAKNDFAMPFIMTPEAAAQTMLRFMERDAFKISFPRAFSWVFRGSQWLPDWAYYRLFASK